MKTSTVRLALPKGRMNQEIMRLLSDAGIRVSVSDRDYRPSISLQNVNVKILKPQNIVGMLDAGARDIGFAGADWVAETGTELVELLDTRLDPVRLVAAAPIRLLQDGRLPDRPLIIATEYERLAQRWVTSRGIDARILRTFGATEVFPPDDADCIIDNTATGSTLRANGLEIIDELMSSSTRLYASPESLEDSERRIQIEEFVLLLRSVLEARRRVMVDLNVASADLQRVVEILPCMREPSISHLRDEGWFAVRAAVPRDQLAAIIPLLKANGARDIVTTAPDQIIP